MFTLLKPPKLNKRVIEDLMLDIIVLIGGLLWFVLVNLSAQILLVN